MSDEEAGNRTARGRPPAPFGTEDTIAAPATPSPDKSPPSPSPESSAARDARPIDPSASLSLPMLDRVRYQIVSEVGRGGLGRVFRARDRYLDRPVAVKELLDNSDPAQRRFVREALITARLQHPAIVPIYDAGQSTDPETGTAPFYSMKLVDGESLADALAGAKSLDDRLALLPRVIAVCDAMAYAHEHKIIHRDLKPQNVLVGKYGETVLIDWGLAKDLRVEEAESTGPYRESAESTETIDGAVLGTPAFMSPEQATAGAVVDERSDVYALGAMLYFLGCGVPPYTGKSLDDILIKVVSGDVVPLREREPAIPEDLAAIVGKAMAHDPDKRYATAKQLTEDLHKFELGHLVGAKTYTRRERLRRWVARNRRVVAVVGVALAILLAYGGWSLRRITAERTRAEEEAARATSNAAEAAKQRDAAVAQSLLVRARQYAATGHTAEELAVLRVLARRRESPEANDARQLAITEGGLIWKGHQRLAMALGRDVGLVARSSDGTRFVATEPGSIAAWDATTGRELARLPYDGGDGAARFGRIAAISPGGRYVVAARCDRTDVPCGFLIADNDLYVLKPGTRLQLRALADGKVLAEWSGADELRRSSMAFAADDSTVAVRRVGDKLSVFGTGARALDVAGCTGSLAVAIGGEIAIGCGNHVRLVDSAGKSTDILSNVAGAGKLQLAFVGSDRLIAVGDTIYLWDLGRGELRGEGKLPEAPDDLEGRDEGEDIAWTYHRPGRPLPEGADGVPQLRFGASLSIIPRTSVLGPPPRIVPGGAVLTTEGADWQALSLSHDQLRYALIDRMVPSEPPDRCLPRVGSERHATIVLDGGARLLVDEQEVPVGLAAAPPEGYRHSTTRELPIRQLRPLVAAEADACLVWGDAVGAHVVDGGAVGPRARAVSDGADGVYVIDREIYRIDASGKRQQVPTAEIPVESPTTAYVASFDLDADQIQLAALPTGKILRTWKPDGEVRTMTWTALDTVEIETSNGTYLVSPDPKIAPRTRPPELVTDARSKFGIHTVTTGDATELVVVRVADDHELWRLPVPSTARAHVVPDGTPSIVIEDGSKREVVADKRARIALGTTKQLRLGDLTVIGGYLISRADSTVAVWELATGRAVAVPVGTRDATIVNEELWTITNHHAPRLSRIRLDGSGALDVRLSTAGMAFHDVRSQIQLGDGSTIQPSPDGKRVSAEYQVTEELSAIATWDAETGALLWVGPPSSSIVGDWVLAGGRAYIPSFDVDQILRDTGARTNLRLCKTDLRAVPVSPPPAPDTYWAPDAACATKAQ